MEKSTRADRLLPFGGQANESSLRFSATRVGNAWPCPRQFTKSSEIGTGLSSPPGTASGQEVLVGAACLATWSLLWLLSISDFVSPRENGFARDGGENPGAMFSFPGEDVTAPGDPRKEESTQVIHVRSSPGACRSGTIELDGRCVFGEEI